MSAAFLTACGAVAVLAGHWYQSQRVAAARLHPDVAVLSQPAPAASRRPAVARATWRLPDGAERSGTVTTVTAPAIDHAPAGTSVHLWLDRSGEPAPEDAADALDYASWAVDQAQLAVLDAIDARSWADARAVASPSS